MIKTQLVDARNFDELLPTIIAAVQAVDFCGLDCETEDSDRHDGLNKFCKYREDGTKAKNTKLVFDFRRMRVCGFSVYPEGHDTAYYVNLYHADVENRVPWAKAKLILDARKPTSSWICHNAPFEITVFRSCFAYELTNCICTLQMGVSAYGDDEYPEIKWHLAGLGDMGRLYVPLMRASIPHDPSKRTFSPEVSDLIYKITAKDSDSAHSYNGFCDAIAYGHGLKRAVKSFFNYEMSTFEETLGEDAHMGQKTGEETADYGAEDAYWAVRLFRHLLQFMATHSPNAMSTFFTQENPMIYLYSDMAVGGLRVNAPAIEDRRGIERVNFANLMRRMKVLIRQTGGFPDDPDERLLKREDWYRDNWKKYRERIWEWANSADSEDDYEQCVQVSGAVSTAWANERGVKKLKGVNFSHYMPMRTILYDLLGAGLVVSDGKLQSDGECRGRIKERFEKLKKEGANNVDEIDRSMAIIDCINEVAGIEQRMKLYLNPYVMLTDPDTDTLYPTVSSQLVSRRMAASNPNPMQLAKRGESTYVRGFFLPDYDDHLIVSIDWSAIELLIIGEDSADPEFVKAYGQLPHEDLHAGASADILSVVAPGLDEVSFKGLKKFQDPVEWCREYDLKPEYMTRLFTNLKGEPLDIGKALKYWRTEVGKGANFNYWYSGWLATVGERLGLTMEQIGEAVDRYRARFADAEAWRLEQIKFGKLNGYVELPDGHRRWRFEARAEFPEMWKAKWAPEDPGFRAVIEYMGNKIHRRAGNQLVNSKVQGTCATIAKRSSLRIKQGLKDMGWTPREARMMIPIHDELVFSVKYDLVKEFVPFARGIMIDHPDLFKLCKLDASPAVGLTFEPFNDKKARLGQMEIFEAPPIDLIPKSQHLGKMSDETLGAVCEYLHKGRSGLLGAQPQLA